MKQPLQKTTAMRCALSFAVLVLPGLSVCMLTTLLPLFQLLPLLQSSSTILDKPTGSDLVLSTSLLTHFEKPIPKNQILHNRMILLRSHNETVGTTTTGMVENNDRFNHHGLVSATTTTVPSSMSIDNNHHSLPADPFCLVHVGKTAGGSISCRLGGSPRLAKMCPKPNTVSLIGRYCKGKLHKQQDWGCFATHKHSKKQQKKDTIMIHHPNASIHTFLFTLRDPIERIKSWFYYEHPALRNVNEPMGSRKELFLACNYSTLDELSQLGLEVAIHGNVGGTKNVHNNPSATNSHHKININPNDDPRVSKKCAQLAWKAISGQIGFLYHNRFNYRYYYDWTKRILEQQQQQQPGQPLPPTYPRVLVIRQEHLSNDWKTLEIIYGVHVQNDVLWKGNHDVLSTIPKASQPTKPQQPMDMNNTYFDTVKLHHSATSPLERVRSSHIQQNPLNRESWSNLCHALCSDILVYRELLERAENLSKQQKDVSWQELIRKCPEHQTPRHQVTCHEHPPILQT